MKHVTLLLFFPFLPLYAGAPSPAEVQALVDTARGAPAEFAADALLRVAGLDKLDKAYRMELLEDAFRLAAGAQQPLKRRPAFFQFEGQTGFLERAWSQDLDAMSLRMRAVALMLPLDPARARHLFTQTPAPSLSRLTCEDPLAYDVSLFYAVLGRVAAETFSAKEIQNEEPFRLVSRYAAIQSPAQLGPLAHLLATANLKDAQFQALLATYTTGMKDLRGDDRSFTFARPAGVQVRELAEAARKRNGNPVPLIETYRGYLVRQLTGARCNDSLRIDVRLVSESVPTSLRKDQEAMNEAAYFNDNLRVDPIRPIDTREEQMPSSAAGEAEGVGACGSEECRDIGRRYRDLLFTPDQRAWSNEEKNSGEWQNRLKEYLSAVADWKQDTGATAAEHFRFKSSVYTDLFNAVPNGSGRERVLRATLTYLQQSRQEAGSLLEWFLPANVLIGRIALDPLGLGPLLEDLKASGDSVISMYARLEQIAPRNPDKILPLF